MKPIILDIRTPAEYLLGHVRHSTLVPTPSPPLSDDQYSILAYTLGKEVEGQPKNREIWVYCRKGRRSAVAKQILDEMGFSRVANLGGVEEGALPGMIDSGQLDWMTPNG